MPKRWCAIGCLILLILAWGGRARARQAGPDRGHGLPPAHLAIVDGAATIERDTRAEPAAPNVPLMPGDRLHTTDGRLEVLFVDGSTLDIDRDTTLDLLDASLIRLLNGRIRITVRGDAAPFDPATAAIYRIDAPGGIVQVDGPGVYAVAASDARTVQVSLAVVRGAATLSTERASLALRAGERTLVRDNGVPEAATAFNVALTDEFGRWADAQLDARVGSRSATYLPLNLDAYAGTFDRNGRWEYLAPYGYVWYPRVQESWRPYYDGQWQDVAPYGWTWIGNEAWAWPVFHYGRWGRSATAWSWIPGRQWSPAWVSWAVAPGYVSWCALDAHDAPAVDLYHPGRHRSAWRGWVVVPHRDFDGRAVARHALRDEALRARPRTFIEQRTAPVPAVRSAATAVALPHVAVPSPLSRVAIPRSLANRNVRVVMPQGLAAAAPPFHGRTPPAVRPGVVNNSVSNFHSGMVGTNGSGLRTILPRHSRSGPPSGRMIGSPWSSSR